MATKKTKKPARPTITLSRVITFVKDGPVTLQATFAAPSLFTPGVEEQTQRPIHLEQPKPWASDEQLRAAVAKLHPGADVVWVSPEP
jgi:hypothetical protein